MNQAQKIILDTYSDGDFAALFDTENSLAGLRSDDKALAECGDGLFKFLMIELSDNEDCDTLETAHDRVLSAIDQLEQLLFAIEGARNVC